MDRHEFSELVALYALDALNEDEASSFDRDFSEMPELALELFEFQAAAATIAYSIPPMPIAPDLKDRLFQRLATESTVPETPLVAKLLQQAETVTWETYAPMPEVQVGTFQLDLEKRQIACFVQAQGPAKFPPHRHAEDEEIVVLQGDLMIDGKLYGSGDRIYSEPGTVHQPETLNGCVLYLRTSLDDELFVND
jgi:hypothetical protein